MDYNIWYSVSILFLQVSIFMVAQCGISCRWINENIVFLGSIVDVVALRIEVCSTVLATQLEVELVPLQSNAS